MIMRIVLRIDYRDVFCCVEIVEKIKLIYQRIVSVYLLEMDIVLG